MKKVALFVLSLNLLSVLLFTMQVAIELVGKTMTEGITVYSIQPLKAMSNHNLTLLVTVVADSYTKDGIAELIRGEFLQLPLSPWQFMVTDIQRYGEKTEKVSVFFH